MINPNQEALAGQILSGQNNRNRKRKNVHSMVYISEAPEQPENFIGVMLTSNSGYKNVLIPNRYFETTDEQGSPYRFPEKETYFRPRRMYKKVEWQPFTVIGKLTPEGLAHIKSKLAEQPPIFYEFNE